VKFEFDMFNALKYLSNDVNLCKVDMINAMVGEEYGRMAIDDLVDHFITFPSNNDLKKFLK
jgi:hypothetical protein